MHEDLMAIAPPTRTVSINGKAIEISPIEINELPQFLPLVRPILEKLIVGDVMGALADDPEAVIRAVAIGSRCEESWLRNEVRRLDVLAQLATAVLEVNADFFTQQVIPIITGALQTAAAGQRSSSGSSAQDSGATK